jgi:hypothetical protein
MSFSTILGEIIPKKVTIVLFILFQTSYKEVGHGTYNPGSVIIFTLAFLVVSISKSNINS